MGVTCDFIMCVCAAASVLVSVIYQEQIDIVSNSSHVLCGLRLKTLFK